MLLDIIEVDIVDLINVDSRTHEEHALTARGDCDK
jgi:hypothetical protein